MMKKRKIVFYCFRKLFGFLFQVFLLSLFVFYLSRLAPTDPLQSYYGGRVEKMSVAQKEWAREKLGLNAPIHVQYIRWVERALHGDFGISFKYKQDVLEVIRLRIGNTLLLGGIGFVLIFTGALAVGILCVWFENRWPDFLLCKLGTLVSCIPEFWFSLVLIFIFSVFLRWLPGSGAYSVGHADDFGDRIYHLVLPMTAIVSGHLWYYAYMIRNKLSEEVRADYALAAKAKGLTKRKVIFRHCLRNILPSYISIMAISVPHVLGGTYLVETVFSYPGIGTLSYESARYADYNMLMVLCMLTGITVIFCNMAGQAVNERIDPRIRDRKAWDRETVKETVKEMEVDAL